MTPLSDLLWALGERSHAPLAALALLGALAVAATTRDLMKRLLAAILSAFAAIATVAASGVAPGELAGAVLVVVAGGALGLVLAAKAGEDFATLDAQAIAAASDADASAPASEP